MFSPISEKPKLPSPLPMPKQSDFIQSESDPYSDSCLEQLESLDNLDDTLEDSDLQMETRSVKNVKKPISIIKLDLKPLELKPPEVKPQKLVTPGNNNSNKLWIDIARSDIEPIQA